MVPKVICQLNRICNSIPRIFEFSSFQGSDTKAFKVLKSTLTLHPFPSKNDQNVLFNLLEYASQFAEFANHQSLELSKFLSFKPNSFFPY